MLYTVAAALVCALAAAAPVRIFILMGQSNMLGMGHVLGNSTNGTLEFAVHNESKCAFSILTSHYTHTHTHTHTTYKILKGRPQAHPYPCPPPHPTPHTKHHRPVPVGRCGGVLGRQ